MKISFSRHARRRIRLYKIPESVILQIIENTHLALGKHTLIQKVADKELPVKIVVVVEESGITIVSAYPLKKGLIQ